MLHYLKWMLLHNIQFSTMYICVKFLFIFLLLIQKISCYQSWILKCVFYKLVFLIRQEKNNFLKHIKQDRLRVLQFAVRLLLSASPAVISAIIFNITSESDAYTLTVHSNVHSTLYTAQRKISWLEALSNKQWLPQLVCLESGGLRESAPCSISGKNKAFPWLICAEDDLLLHSHILLSPLSAFSSRTALKKDFILS